MLYGTLPSEVFYSPVESEQVALVDGAVAVKQELCRAPAEECLEEHARHLSQLGLGVDGGKFGKDVALDVAHLVGRDM